MFKGFITQLCMYVKAIRILAKGYLPILLITHLKIKRNFRSSKNHNKENESRL